MQVTFQSSLRYDDSYRPTEAVLGPLGEPRAPIPPKETKEEKRKRVMKDIEAHWARRESIINDVCDHYSQPLRILGRISFYKTYPEAKEVQKQQEQDLIKWHRSLPPHCVQATSYGELEGISRLLGQEIPTAFYRSTPRSLFRSYAYYCDLGHHPNQKKPRKFSRDSQHHMEHHKDVNRIVDHPELLPSIYHKFLQHLNTIKLDIIENEHQTTGDLFEEQNKVTPFPIYVSFGGRPKPCFIHPAFAPLKIGRNPKLPEQKRYKLPISLKRRELELIFPNSRLPRKKDSPASAKDPDSNTMFSSPMPTMENDTITPLEQ